PTSGQYTVRVNDYYYGYYGSTATGTYSFKLTQVPAAQVFAVAIGDTISDGVPSAGAGNIESPGSDDEYAFTGTAGQVIRFDDLGALACCTLYWQLYAPDGTQLAADWFGDSPGRQVMLPTSGQYTVRVNDYYYGYYYCYYSYYGTATGTYSFKLTQVPAAQVFAIALGTTVSNGSPVAGAGNIEAEGSDDEYAFSGTAGQTIRLNDLEVLPCCSLY